MVSFMTYPTAQMYAAPIASAPQMYSAPQQQQTYAAAAPAYLAPTLAPAQAAPAAAPQLYSAPIQQQYVLYFLSFLTSN